jgi:hypothetical protein
MKKHLLLALAQIIVTVSAFGAASAEQAYYPTSQVRENDWQDITDEDIRNAFEAEPQIRLPLRVAWYNLGTDAILDQIVISDFEVESSYRIPKTIIEGFGAGTGYGTYSYFEPTTLNLRALRLAAARAKCDVLVLVGSSFRGDTSPNWLAVFNILIFPLLFNPAYNMSADYAVEMYVIDVRNEYLYGQIVYDPDPIVAQHLRLGRIRTVLEEARLQLVAEAASHLSSELDALIERYVSEPGTP